MEKPALIVNPRSGGGMSEAAWAKAAGRLTDGLGPFDAFFTKHAGHASDLAAQCCIQGRDLVIAMGGDGTINEVVNGLMRHDTRPALGVIHHGTGGDFRRTLKLPKGLEANAAHIKNMAAAPVDVAKVCATNENGARVERHFINASSFGFSAAVAQKANDSSKRLGAGASFLSATMRTLVGNQPADVDITWDDSPSTTRHVLLLGAIGNGRFFGGGMQICPHARLNSGLLDVVLVSKLNALELLTKINRIYDGTHMGLKQVAHRQVKRVAIRPVDGDKVIKVEVDGEVVGNLPATFEVIPGALRLQG